MSNDPRGLYEVLVTSLVQSRLQALSTRWKRIDSGLRPAEAADRIALHLSRIIQRAVEDVPEEERVLFAVRLAHVLVQQLITATNGGISLDESPLEPGLVLRAIVGLLPDGTPETLRGPLIPLLDTTLLTNAPGEPRVGSQIAAEIESADGIDVVMAFIRFSGVRQLIDALQRHCFAGRPLRVLTTIYTGSTEVRALEALTALGATIRISYDTSATRLHAKGWLFRRHSGFSTAYIGSSNLTHSAQHDGLEWNVRVSAARNADVLDKMNAVFESYWRSPDFTPYKREEFEAKLARATPSDDEALLTAFELQAQPFQERLLEQLEVSRRLGHHRNLLVSATGTGKTVMAALDFANLRERLPRSRLLFVAHREEILKKARTTFRLALRDHSFGELWVGGQRPERFEHIFASIQSLSATGFSYLTPEHFDVVIVDEFHHAAAKSYDALLAHVRPLELLGMTATPERSDGLPLLHWFGGRIAAELRLWDAIEQHRLCPFAYYGIYDGVDLRDIPWRRGRGYDTDQLTNVLTADDAWAHLVLKQLREYVGDLSKMRALAFCVSVRHAKFMARVCAAVGIRSMAVSAETEWSQRIQALRDLEAGTLNIVFSVDLFNEGIDVPAVDTLLLLRPTESPTLFLQQLGRGLRKHRGKSVCTVLDFVGHHRKEFRFDRRFRALLGGSRVDVIRQIKEGFPFLPAGCHLQLDRVSQEIVLDNIRRAIPSQWAAKVEELRSLRKSSDEVTLVQYIAATGLDLEDVCDGKRSWAELRAAAGLPVAPPGPEEIKLRRACGRLLHIDDLTRIDTYLRLLSGGRPEPAALATPDQRLLRMLVASVAEMALDKHDNLTFAADLLWSHPQVMAELSDVLHILRGRITHVQHAIDGQPDVPLRVHARYTRIEILAGFGVGETARPPEWREGVRFAKEVRADLCAFTLDKTGGHFSPTTRYKDYAISRDRIHWETQSTLRAASETGQRYRNHIALGTSIMLFARLRDDDRAFWFLGPAIYESHTGEAPMAITWRLPHPLPGDLFSQFAAAVA